MCFRGLINDPGFPGTLIVTRATERGRISVRGMDWIREADGHREKGIFPDPEARKSFVCSEFGIRIPDGPAGGGAA